MAPQAEDISTTPKGSTSHDSERRKLTLVDGSNLSVLQERPPFGTYLRHLWQRRHFIIAHAKSTALGTGRDTFLGKFWIILDPLLQVAVYALIFGLVLKTSRGMDNFIGFLVIGVIFFRFLSGGMTSGSGLIQKSRPLISSFQFPRAAVAFSTTLRNFLDNIAPAIMAVAIALLFQPDKPVSWSILLVLPLFILAHIFAAGSTLIVARLTAFIPDFKSAVRVIVQGLFFLSGIFFSLDRFNSHPEIRAVMEYNPFYQFLTAVRICVLEGRSPTVDTWAYLAMWSVGILTIGLLYFWRKESKYARVK